MQDAIEVQQLVGSLRLYLEEIAETGVDSLAYAEASAVGGVGNIGIMDQGTMPSNEGAAKTVFSAPATVPGKDALERLRLDMGDCSRCRLCETRNSLVFGVGDPHARLVFVGEAPGRDEDLRGEPFVGEAGQLLTKIIIAMKLQREDVYICNILKCRPPNNRNPLPQEIEQCQPFLLRQIRAINPLAIVCLGTFAAQTLLGTKAPISKLRGRFHNYHGIPLMPTFHPAFLLRNPAMKRDVWEDMQKVMEILEIDVKND